MTNRSHMNRRVALSLIAAGALGATPVTAAPTEVVPGVTYERIERPGPSIVHVMRVQQGPLISIRPVLTGGAPSARGRLTSAMAARLGDGAVVGVNGDFFNFENSYPSGLLMLDREVVNEPEATRSAMLLFASGAVQNLKTSLAGTWQALPDPANPTVVFPERGFIGINRPAERDSETILYTPRYGTLTPTGDRVDALITLDPPGVILPNVPLTGTVQTIQPGGGSGIGPGKVVLSGVGTAGTRISSDLATGRRVTLTAALPGITPEVTHAMGGGPVLVANGAAIHDAGEGFTFGQVGTRTSRTAIGQQANGDVLLVATEGPSTGARGVTAAEQADLMVSLGASTAIGMDSGGSTTMAIRDQLLTPFGSERSITNALVVSYGGVQLTQPSPFLSPNGDGVDEATRTTARSPEQGTVRITLARGNGRPFKMLYAGPLDRAGKRLALGASTFGVKDGLYRVNATFRPADGSAPTSHGYSVAVDRTLGFLRLQKVGKTPAAKLKINYRLAKTAQVSMRVRNAAGGDVKLLLKNRVVRAGQRSVTWDMRRKGKPLPAGIYTVSVRIATPYGEYGLAGRFKAPKPPKKPTPAKPAPR